MHCYFTKPIYTICCMAIVVNILVGCGSDSVDTQQSNVNEVDLRFATAESLVAHITSLTERDNPDFRAYYDLFYPETPAQEAWDQFADEYILPTFEFELEVYKQFGEEADVEIAKFAHYRTKNLRLIENSEPRAKAVFDSEVRDNKEIHLIKVGNRWWVSGYTWEYNPIFNEAKVLEASQSSIGLKIYIDQIIRHLKEGTFQTAEAAREAFKIAMRSHAAAGNSGN